MSLFQRCPLGDVPLYHYIWYLSTNDNFFNYVKQYEMLNHNTVAYFISLSLLFLLHSKQVIKSFSYKVFYAFIKYLYTDEVNMKSEDAIGKLLSAVKTGSVFEVKCVQV